MRNPAAVIAGADVVSTTAGLDVMDHRVVPVRAAVSAEAAQVARVRRDKAARAPMARGSVVQEAVVIVVAAVRAVQGATIDVVVEARAATSVAMNRVGSFLHCRRSRSISFLRKRESNRWRARSS
jgi:hypothetical protein